MRVVPFAGRACLKVDCARRRQDLVVDVGQLPKGTLSIEASLLGEDCGGSCGCIFGVEREFCLAYHTLALGYRRLRVKQQPVLGHRDAAPSITVDLVAAENPQAMPLRSLPPMAEIFRFRPHDSCMHIAVKWVVIPSMEQLQLADNMFGSARTQWGTGARGRATSVTHSPFSHLHSWPALCNSFILVTMQGAISTGHHVADGDGRCAWDTGIPLHLRRMFNRNSGRVHLAVGNGGLLRLLVNGWSAKKAYMMIAERLVGTRGVGVAHTHNDGGFDGTMQHHRHSVFAFVFHQ